MPRLFGKPKERTAEEKEKDERFKKAIGMYNRPVDICIPDYCKSSKLARSGGKKCNEGHEAKKQSYCEWHSDPQYRQKGS